MIPDDREKISSEFRVYVKWTASSLIDTLYLMLWAMLQWGANTVISSLKLSGIDATIFLILQVLGGASTLTPTLIYIYTDTRIMWIKSTAEIKKARSWARDYLRQNKSK